MTEKRIVLFAPTKLVNDNTQLDLGNETLGRISALRKDRNRVALMMEVGVAQRLLHSLAGKEGDRLIVSGIVRNIFTDKTLNSIACLDSEKGKLALRFVSS
jgi:hypothetical protein